MASRMAYEKSYEGRQADRAGQEVDAHQHAVVVSDAKENLRPHTQNHAVFAFARAAKVAQAKAQKDAAAPTAKGAPGQPIGAPQANKKPRAFDEANTPNVPKEEKDAASSPRGGVEEGWYSRASCWIIESAPKPGEPRARPRSIIPG